MSLFHPFVPGELACARTDPRPAETSNHSHFVNWISGADTRCRWACVLAVRLGTALRTVVVASITLRWPRLIELGLPRRGMLHNLLFLLWAPRRCWPHRAGPPSAVPVAAPARKRERFRQVIVGKIHSVKTLAPARTVRRSRRQCLIHHDLPALGEARYFESLVTIRRHPGATSPRGLRGLPRTAGPQGTPYVQVPSFPGTRRSRSKRYHSASSCFNGEG